MLFKTKKENKIEILQKKNIKINCEATDKITAIRMLGKMLVESGYVRERYIEGMFEREETFATNMGNGIAIPHGALSVKSDILSSGLAIMIIPEGMDWDEGDKVKVVIAIAGKGDEHLSLLENIAEKFSEDNAAEEWCKMDVDMIYQEINRKEV